MLASKLSYELSVRLGDPIHPETPDEQGNVFSGEQRLKYLSRAFSKLTRMLKILMRDYQPEFNKRRAVNAKAITDESDYIIPINANIKIDELYVKYKYNDGKAWKEAIVPATYMEPSKYLTNKYNPNDVKSVSFEEGNIKYTLMITRGFWQVYLLPKPVGGKSQYLNIEYLEIPDFELISWESDIPITADYIDLLIDLAAIQGMQDIARADKAQLISQSINTDWQILGQYGTYMKQTEGVKE